jgi:integrase
VGHAVRHTGHMAWAERLPSGKYRGLYRDAAGKKHSVGQLYAHKAAAERAAASQEERARKSLSADPEAYKRPWGEWCDVWWPTREVEPTTAKIDASRRRTHLDPRWATTPLISITRHDVKAWAAAMKRAKVGPSTVQRAVHLFSASLEAAVDAEILQSNPAARIKLTGGSQAQERFLTREEFAAIREQLPTTDHQLVADLLVYTGLRWGEMAGLHWNRVDLDRGILRVVETWDEPSARIKAYPKGKQTRDVPLTAELVAALRERPVGEAGCGVEHATGTCRSSLAFTTERGSVLRNSNWSDAWRTAVEHSGVGHARIHDLRHTYASWLLQAGIALAEVGRLMGHVSTQTTAKYAHLAAPPNEAVLAALTGLAAPDLPHEGPRLTVVQA